jgi:hypothetical protein
LFFNFCNLLLFTDIYYEALSVFPCSGCADKPAMPYCFTTASSAPGKATPLFQQVILQSPVIYQYFEKNITSGEISRNFTWVASCSR